MSLGVCFEGTSIWRPLTFDQNDLNGIKFNELVVCYFVCSDGLIAP